METLTIIQNVLTVAIGLGFVIFIHELGHFLLAKWNGVKVEKFSIGFDPYGLKFGSFRRGETTYVLGAIPLGGYVKMLGEAPEEQAEAASDPRAYSNKSVGARMSIISAGVIMNLISGLAFFTFAYAWGGKDEVPARLGMVVAGRPAYEAGVRTGDEIVALDGERNITFEDVYKSIVLSGTGQVMRLDLKRPGQSEPISVRVEPTREASAERPSIGINPASGLALSDESPFQPPPGLEGKPAGPDAGFKPGDRIVRVGPEGETAQPVADAFDLDRLLARYADRPLTFVVERGKDPKGRKDATADQAKVTIPPHHFVDFGFRLAMGPIASIQGGSIAQKAGFRKGDTILKVDDQADLDPMRLPTYIYEHAGRPVAFEVRRGPGEGEGETTTIIVRPDDTPPWSEPVTNLEPQEIPGLGLAYEVPPRIVAVRESSPAARAGLKPGDVIESLSLLVPRGKERAVKPFPFKLDGKEFNWPAAFSTLQDPTFEHAPEPQVELAIQGRSAPIRLTPEPDPTWYHPSRGLRLTILSRPIPPMGLHAAFRHGLREVYDNAVSVYYMIRGLVQQRLGKENFGGPIRIAGMAYHSANSGLGPFLYFLGMLSVNLAVLNFLPIPPLDGGQMVFLLAEKVRGRPLPESALSLVMLIGVVFVLGLMAFFVFQDLRLTLLPTH